MLRPLLSNIKRGRLGPDATESLALLKVWRVQRWLLWRLLSLDELERDTRRRCVLGVGLDEIGLAVADRSSAAGTSPIRGSETLPSS